MVIRSSPDALVRLPPRSLKPWVILKRWRRAIAVAATLGAAIPLLVALGVWIASFGVAFPSVLQTPPTSSVRILDRNGHLLARVRRDGHLSERVTLEELSPHVVPALLAAEDKRFFSHPGVDPIAVLRAGGQAIMHARVVSGGSTLTQQLARTTFARPRTLLGKLREMAVALRIEREWTKPRILEAYLNRVGFGPGVVGIDAAARWYFDKPAKYLSLSESATLVSIPRGPTLYDPRRARGRAERRRNRVLGRMVSAGAIGPEDAARARSVPLDVKTSIVWPGAHHWVRRLSAGGQSDEVHSTLDSSLQRRIEELTLSHGRAMKDFGATAASVLVVDNQSREVLAYVGSPNYQDVSSQGQNDGAMALRQPGSALKPFVYAAAMEQLGYTAATLLPDIELELGTPEAPFSPRNYDRRFRGPVRLRDALANSLNVPAAYTAARLGLGNALEALHRFGFRSLRESPDHYGAAVALGDGEVTLEELAAAYVALTNGGAYAPLRLVHEETDALGVPPSVAGPPPVAAPRAAAAPSPGVGSPRRGGRRATTPEIAAIIWDILADPRARAGAFGRNGVLEFPYQVAVKTGTSKGARDNWTVGSTPRVTVAVWVGNFDGKPMLGASGVSGAGPLFHAVMDETVRSTGGPEPPRDPQAGGLALRRAEICALSGELATELCASRLLEWFVVGTEPLTRDTMHARVFVKDGRLAAESCPRAVPTVVEVYPDKYRRWARDARRPLAPEAIAADCPPDELPLASSSTLRIVFPRDGARYTLSPGLAAGQQQLVFEVRGAGGGASVEYVLDGRSLGRVGESQRYTWTPDPGHHTLVAADQAGRMSEPVSFLVYSPDDSVEQGP